MWEQSIQLYVNCQVEVLKTPIEVVTYQENEKLSIKIILKRQKKRRGNV